MYTPVQYGPCTVVGVEYQGWLSLRWFLIHDSVYWKNLYILWEVVSSYTKRILQHLRSKQALVDDLCRILHSVRWYGHVIGHPSTKCTVPLVKIFSCSVQHYIFGHIILLVHTWNLLWDQKSMIQIPPGISGCGVHIQQQLTLVHNWSDRCSCLRLLWWEPVYLFYY